MGKQKFEFELLDGRRDAAVQQQQFTKWPFPQVCNQNHCEFQYRAFRDAYNKLETDYETGGKYMNALSDAELRMRWLDYYVGYEDPPQQQIAKWAYYVSRGRHDDRDFDPSKIIGAALVIFAVLYLLSQ